MRTLLGIFALWCLAPLAFAQAESANSPNYVADIELETSAEFVELLQRASQLLVDGVASQEGAAKVSFVLHGPVIKDLLRQNYIARRELVDLAASLTALDVVEIKVCRTWMGINGVAEEDLQPFVETVALGGSEVQRLQVEKNYVDF